MSASRAGPIRLLIDGDPGVDDAVALALALSSEEVEVQAVTTVAGNVPLHMTTANALGLLEAFGRPEIPVAAGAGRALVRRAPGHPPVHGANGLGGIALESDPREALREHAVDLMARLIQEAPPRSVTVAGLGPLTNVALLLALHPHLATRIERVVAMSGTIGAGNITPVAEFNAWADPEAAQRVLADSEVEVCMVPLDVTRRATLSESALRTLRRHSTRGALLADIVAGYGDWGADGPRLHDALVVAALIEPSLLRTVSARLDVDTGTGLSRGQTVCAPDMPLAGWGGFGDGVVEQDVGTRVQVAVDVDADRFRALLVERLGSG